MKTARARSSLSAGLLVLMTLVAYIPAMRGGYIWDDDAHVYGNDTLRSLDGLRRIWGAIAEDRWDFPITTQYYPLVFSSFWLEYHLWGLHPLGYHVTNVLLHALNAILLWFVLRRLSVPGAWLAAAIFALHPVHVESVAWITERKNVLSGAFYLSAMLAYLRFRPANEVGPSRAAGSPSRGPWRYYALAIGMFLCALLSKTVTCSMPAALLLLIWWKQRRIQLRAVLPLVPLFALGAALGLTTAWKERYDIGAAGAAWALSFVERCLVAGRALWFYAHKLIWPHPLIFNYPRWQIDAALWWQYLFPLAVLAVIVVLWAFRARIGKAPLVAVLFFAGTLTPALGFFNVYPMVFSYVADHFQYLASVGLIGLFAGVATETFRRFRPWGPPVGSLSAVAMLAVLGALVWKQGHAYRDTETLYRDILAKNPASWMAHVNLAGVLQGQGKLDEAMDHCTEAVRLNPDSGLTHNSLGNLLVALGQLDQGIAQYNEALRLNPDLADAHDNLGLALITQGKADEAVGHFTYALRLRHDHVGPLHNLGVALYMQGKVEQAIAQFTKVLRFKPDHVNAHVNLGVALRRQGDPTQAIAHFTHALRVQPNHLNAHYNLALALHTQGKVEQAIAQYNEVLRLDPNHLKANNHLAWLLATHQDAKWRDGAKAVRLAQRACELTHHRSPLVLDTLAAAYAETSRFDEATRLAQKGIDLAVRSGQEDLANLIRSRLEWYSSGQPFRETTP